MRGVVYKLCVILIIGFLFTGCKVRRPGNIIPEGKMENLLYDYHIAKAMGENLPYNESYKRVLYIDYVFDKYGTDQAAFDTSMVWYTRHADVLSKIYERINIRMKAEQAEIDRLIAIRDNKPQISQPGDSIDVWPRERMMLLSTIPLSNKLNFVVPSDSNFHARDTLEWNVKFHFRPIPSDSLGLALMSMAIQYANDSIISATRTIREPGLQTIRLQSDTLGDIKEIRGFIYLKGQSDSIRHLFADQISLMRYHSTDSLFAAKSDSIDTEKVEKEEVVDKDEIKAEPLDTQRHERLTPEDMRRNRPRPVQRSAATLQEEIKQVDEDKK